MAVFRIGIFALGALLAGTSPTLVKRAEHAAVFFAAARSRRVIKHGTLIVDFTRAGSQATVGGHSSSMQALAIHSILMPHPFMCRVPMSFAIGYRQRAEE